MSTLIENVFAGDVTRVLSEKGIPADTPVTVVVDEDPTEIARRIRATAKARGMTDAIFQELTKDL